MNTQPVIDNILQTCLKKIEVEVGALLGQTVTTSRHVGSFISKEEYLTRMEEQAVLTRMAVSGDQQDEAYVIVGLATAITYGGTLIMLPDDEIKSRIKSKTFDEEVADAFGEIGNIIAGVYTAVFLERFKQKLHCKKTEVTAFAPWEATDTNPFPEKLYYLSTSNMKLDDREMGTIETLFPVEMLELTPPNSVAASKPETQDKDHAKINTESTQGEKAPVPGSRTLSGEENPGLASAGTTFSPNSPESATAAAAASNRTASRAATGDAPARSNLDSSHGSADPESCPLLLVAAETQEEANAFGVPLASRHFEILCLTFQDNLKEAVWGKNLKGVVLVMREVGERGLASLIKIRSAVDLQTPLVVAGPQWTRRTVLQALKYGARDILVLPAEAEEVFAKVRAHMPQ